MTPPDDPEHPESLRRPIPQNGKLGTAATIPLPTERLFPDITMDEIPLLVLGESLNAKTALSRFNLQRYHFYSS